MRVLTIVPDLNMGGTQRVAQNVTVSLQDQGLDVALLTTHGGGPREDILRQRDIPVFIHGQHEAAIDAALAWRPDIVHIHRTGHSNAAETGLLSRFKAAGARIVETNVFARYDGTVDPALFDAHILLSRWCYFKWSRWRGRADSTLSVIIPNAVDVTAFTRAPVDVVARVRAEFGIPEGAFVFGRIGQPDISKWSIDTVTAFAAVAARHDDVHLVVVGLPEGLRTAVCTLPEAVRRRIVQVAPVFGDQRLSEILSAFDCFLHTSLIGESFGMVLCEAMLCDVPVITLSTPYRDNSQIEVVRHLEVGIVVHNRAALVAAMESACAGSPVYEELRGQGREHVVHRYSTGVVGHQTLQLYELLLGQRRLDEVDQNIIPDSSFSSLAFARNVQHIGFGRPNFIIQIPILWLIHFRPLYELYKQLKWMIRRR